MNILFPAKLNRGDLIGIVAPAGPVLDAAKIERGVRYLEKLGYRTLVGNHATQIRGYLAGTDAERVADLHAMFAHKEVRAIFCARGGYGTTRLLPLLDYSLIARNPKILVGFSDITALQLALWKKCRLVTFHGPMVAAEMAKEIDADTEAWLWRLLTSNHMMEPLVFQDTSVETFHPGQTHGRLLGGNLTLITALLGTPYEPTRSRALWFLEEVSEEPYRLDRMLTQLQQSGILSKAAGFITGQFKQCQPKDKAKPSCSLEEVLREVAARNAKPFLANLPFGHVARKLTFPMGLRARLDADARQITFLESAVR